MKLTRARYSLSGNVITGGAWSLLGYSIGFYLMRLDPILDSMPSSSVLTSPPVACSAEESGGAPTEARSAAHSVDTKGTGDCESPKGPTARQGREVD